MTGKKTSLEEQSSQTNKSPPFLLEDVLAIVSGYFLRNNIPPPKEQDPNEKIEKHAFTLVKLYSIASKQLQGKIEIKIKEHGEQLTGSDLKNICEESEKLGIMILKDPKLHEKLNGNNLATVCQKNTILGKKILQNPTLYKKLNSENLFDICKHNTQQSTELGQIILENLTMSGRLIHSNVPGTYFACIARENPTLGKIISTNPKFYNCLTDSNFAFMCTGPFISPMVILNNIDLYNEFSPYVLLEICKKNTGFGIIILTLPTFRKTKEFNSWLSDRLMSADNEELKKIIRRRRLFTALAMTSVLFKPFSLIIDALTECIRLLCLLLTKETRDPLKNQKMSYTLRLLGTLIKAVMSILLLTTAILTGLHLVASIGITVHIGVNFLTPLVLKIMALLYMIPPNPLLCVLVPQIFFFNRYDIRRIHPSKPLLCHVNKVFA